MMMALFVETQQTTENALVQRLQDDAYTLAYYLLGNEGQAESATEAAFSNLGRGRAPHFDRLRMDVFQGILSRCWQERVPVTSMRRTGDISGLLQTVSIEERSVVVLVDVLGLSYEEAARVLQISKKHIMRLLAQARLHLAA